MGECRKVTTSGTSILYVEQESIACDLLIIMRDLNQCANIYFKYDTVDKKRAYFYALRGRKDQMFNIIMWNEKSVKANLLHIDTYRKNDKIFLQLMCPHNYAHGFSSILTSIFRVTYQKEITSLSIQMNSIKTVQRVFEFCQSQRPSEELLVINGGRMGGKMKQIELTFAIDVMELLFNRLIKRSYRSPKKAIEAHKVLLAISDPEARLANKRKYSEI